MRLFKVLGPAGESIHGGSCEWSLPRGKRTGAWMPAVAPRLCKSGYHVVRAWRIPEWSRDGCTVYEVDTRGAMDGDPAGEKVAVESCRLLRCVQWNERIARLYAADCAAHVYHLSGQDPMVAAAIVAARQFARGEIGLRELDAAWDAARAAAWDAAWAAAWDAARAAAWAAAWAAARAAARAAAWAAALEWQERRLLAYLDGRVKRDVPLRRKATVGR
jgi:hypothetical protein